MLVRRLPVEALGFEEQLCALEVRRLGESLDAFFADPVAAQIEGVECLQLRRIG